MTSWTPLLSHTESTWAFDTGFTSTAGKATTRGSTHIACSSHSPPSPSKPSYNYSKASWGDVGTCLLMACASEIAASPIFSNLRSVDERAKKGFGERGIDGIGGTNSRCPFCSCIAQVPSSESEPKEVFNVEARSRTFSLSWSSTGWSNSVLVEVSWWGSIWNVPRVEEFLSVEASGLMGLHSLLKDLMGLEGFDPLNFSNWVTGWVGWDGARKGSGYCILACEITQSPLSPHTNSRFRFNCTRVLMLPSGIST